MEQAVKSRCGVCVYEKCLIYTFSPSFQLTQTHPTTFPLHFRPNAPKATEHSAPFPPNEELANNS